MLSTSQWARPFEDYRLGRDPHPLQVAAWLVDLEACIGEPIAPSAVANLARLRCVDPGAVVRVFLAERSRGDLIPPPVVHDDRMWAEISSPVCPVLLGWIRGMDGDRRHGAPPCGKGRCRACLEKRIMAKIITPAVGRFGSCWPIYVAEYANWTSRIAGQVGTLARDRNAERLLVERGDGTRYVYATADLAGRSGTQYTPMAPVDALDHLIERAVSLPGYADHSWSKGWQPPPRSKKRDHGYERFNGRRADADEAEERALEAMDVSSILELNEVYTTAEIEQQYKPLFLRLVQEIQARRRHTTSYGDQPVSSGPDAPLV